MGIKPKVIVAPTAMAEFAQRAATFQKAFTLSPAMETFVKQSQDFQSKLKTAFDKSGIAKLAKQIKNTFAKAKDFFQQKLVKFLPIALPLFEIPRVSIQPSSGKSLQLPNSYRSHSPPLYSVIV
jgi:hypothetical protein